MYATPDRNNNYDIRKYPWRWNQFKEYTYNQISELMHDYGSMDILWLDGGWVRPLETVTMKCVPGAQPFPPGARMLICRHCHHGAEGTTWSVDC